MRPFKLYGKDILLMKRILAMIACVGVIVLGVDVNAAKRPAKPADAIQAQTNKPAEAAKPADTNQAAGAATNQPPPKIVFEKTVYDFGTTSMVQQLTGTFTFQNTGKGVLELKKPTTSCGCTVAGVKPDRLNPGEKGELVFTLNVANIQRGHAEKHITVPSNDPDNPSINLTVKADMTSVLDVSPQSVNVGQIRQGATTNVSLSVKRTDGAKLNLSKVEPTQSFMTTHIVPDEKEPSAATVSIAVKGEGTPRRFSDRISLFLEDPSKPAFVVNVFGQLVGDVSLTPEQVFWGVPDAEQWSTSNETMTTRNIRVTANTSQPLEIKNLTSSLPDVKVSLSQIETGKVYEVVAKLPEAPKRSETGTITFETNYASQRTVTVPVRINVLNR
jgi:hypothetical protein